jgi:hypothetical protein
MRLAAACFVLAVTLATSAATAATISILNVDGPNEGFNDNTPATPEGGNTGTTRGQQRLNVFNRAAQIWGSILPSPVEIRVEAKFDPLTCTPTGAVLGFASAIEVDMNFPNAPFTSTWYHIALASKISGVDRNPADNDITTTFNVTIDNDPMCLGGATWYYGYDGNEGTAVDLLPVVLHEMAHGLGFSTLTNATTGAFFGSQPDVYAQFLFDTTAGLHWPDMTNGQRAASAVNTGNLVWDGPSTTAAAPNLLGPRPVLNVTTPPAIAGAYAIGTASFGPQLTVGGLTGEVVLANDGTPPTSDACSPLVNGAQVTGRIVLIDRGTCTFVSKVQMAETAGAIGVIIVDNVSGSSPPGLGGADPGIGIPTISLRQADGATLRAQLGVTTVTVTMQLDPTRIAGADAQGRVILFTPNPLQQGSSVSHWDVSCTPNALMEPAINRDLPAGSIDLTRMHFEDIGWTPATPVALEDFVAEASSEGVTLRWRAVDGDFTGFDVLRATVHPQTSEFDLRNSGAPLSGGGPQVWVDRDVAAGTTYAYRIVGRLRDGGTVVAGPVLATVEAPRQASLTVSPNPLRGTDATLQYALPRAGAVSLEVFDLAGRRVREVARSTQSAGLHVAHWDGRDDAGRHVANGVYVARLATSGGTTMRRIAVLQ